MSDLLLIDFTRTFLDSRPCLTARNSKDALRLLSANEGKIKTIWIDGTMGPADSIKPILDFFVLRSKIGMPYRGVNAFVVHSPDEASWQLLNAKLTGFGYRTIRGTIRDTLG